MPQMKADADMVLVAIEKQTSTTEEDRRQDRQWKHTQECA